jgi:hypothetical protein
MRTHNPSRMPCTRTILISTLAVTVTLTATTAVTPAARAAQPCPHEAVRAESNVNPVTGEPYSTELPDCRAYELVSSANKNDSDAMLSPLPTNGHSGISNFGLVFDDGGRLLWNKEVEPYSGSTNGDGDVYEATRDASGWSQTDALEPSGIGSEVLLQVGAASDGASPIVLKTKPHAGLGQLSSGENEVIERGANGSYTPILNVPYREGVEPEVELSADGSHVFIQTPASLAGDTHSEGRQLYEWTTARGLHPLGVDDLDEPVSACGATLAGQFTGTISYPSVSENGERVFFAAPDPREKGTTAAGPPCKRPSELYLRENGARTIEISKAPAGAAECEPGVTECEAAFVGATPDGSRVFFVTTTQLTLDKQSSDPDLYEYDVETRALSRLSAGPVGYDDADVALPPITGRKFNEDVPRSVVVSGDGTHVYFTGKGQLVPGAGATATANKEDDTVNLYMHANGAVSFIATIEPGTWDGNSVARPQPEAPLGVHVAAVTPDGSDLIFDTDTQLTTYDSEGRGELYRYDAPSHTVSCISCNPSVTEPPNGFLDAMFHTNFWGGTGTAGANGPVQQVGGLSNDGDTVFFAAAEQLLPAASNAILESENPIYDIYEWHDGVLSLISSGTSPSSDFLLGASPSGSDVFFMSATEFAPEDREHSYQIWDARAEGGLSAPATPLQCESAATCRSMVATPPTTIDPATVSVSSPGDVAAVAGAESPPPVKPKVESRGEKLGKALKRCRELKKKPKRLACEKTVHGKYGPRAKKKT